MRRTAIDLTMVVLMLLLNAHELMGGGSGNPGVPANKSITGPAVSGIIVMDPHMVGITTKAKQAAIRLEKGSVASGAVFNVPATFLLFRGCDLSKTTERFVITADKENKLTDWIPAAPIVTRLFEDLGITVSPTNVPVITDVDRDVCTVDPENPGPIPDGGDGMASAPGILSMHVLIQFLIPSPRQNP